MSRVALSRFTLVVGLSSLVLHACTNRDGVEIVEHDPPCLSGEVAVEGGRCFRPAKPGICPPERRILGDGTCACAPGSLEQTDGSCLPAGVPPENCGEGFVADGNRGCIAVLPKDSCPKGQMALPGETACRPVAPCGAGKYGDAPIDELTQFVDGSYSGMDSDGSEARPWWTISDAIKAAAPGATIAIAEGYYFENLSIDKFPVRLWGACPEKVQISPSPNLGISGGKADGTEIHNLKITGWAGGIYVSNAANVVIDRVWIHEGQPFGLRVDESSTVITQNSLIEGIGGRSVGIYGNDTTVTIVDSVIRNATSSFLDLNADTGGIFIWDANPDDDMHPTVIVDHSIVEKNEGYGIHSENANVTLRSVVVADNLPGTNYEGEGVDIRNTMNSSPTSPMLSIKRSILERNQLSGLGIAGANAVIESTVIRGTLPYHEFYGGWGVGIMSAGSACGQPNVALRRSLIEENCQFGISTWNSNVTIESCAIRTTKRGGQYGYGLYMSAAGQEQADVHISGAVIEDNEGAGIINYGGILSVESSAILACGDASSYIESGPSVDGVKDHSSGHAKCGCKTAEKKCEVSIIKNEVPKNPSGTVCESGGSSSSSSSASSSSSSSSASSSSSSSSGISCGTGADGPWAAWPMPTPVGSGLPNPASYSVDVTNGVVTDNVTGLMWQRTVDANTYTWADAKAYCDNLEHAGHSDWRLPSRIELISLVDYTKYEPAIDTDVFPLWGGQSLTDGFFWTSSPEAGTLSRIWCVLFDQGSSFTLNGTDAIKARCVR